MHKILRVFICTHVYVCMRLYIWTCVHFICMSCVYASVCCVYIYSLCVCIHAYLNIFRIIVFVCIVYVVLVLNIFVEMYVCSVYMNMSTTLCLFYASMHASTCTKSHLERCKHTYVGLAYTMRSPKYKNTFINRSFGLLTGACVSAVGCPFHDCCWTSGTFECVHWNGKYFSFSNDWLIDWLFCF